MGNNDGSDQSVATFDTSMAAHARMKELDARMGVLLDKVKANPKDPSRWTFSASSSTSSSKNDAESVSNSRSASAANSRSVSAQSTQLMNNTSITSNNTTFGGDNSSSGLPALSTVQDDIIRSWTDKLNTSREAIVKQHSSSPKKGDSTNTNNNKADNEEEKTITIKDVEIFCFSHPLWKAIPKIASQTFMNAVRDSLMSDAGPLFPPDFVHKNRMYPTIKSTKDSSGIENCRFVRDSEGSLFGCCGGDAGGKEEYQRAVDRYNMNFVDSLLTPETAVLKEKSVTAIGEVVVWRGRVLLNAVKQGWIPPASTVCQYAVPILQSQLAQYPSSASALNKLIRDFINLQQKFPSSTAAAGGKSGDVTLTAVVVSDHHHHDSTATTSISSSSGSDEEFDLWTLFESFLHILVTAHFHCNLLFQRHYPKYLSAVSSQVISRVRRIVWSLRKNILTKCAYLWCSNFAVSVIDRLVDEASTNAVMKLTQHSEGNNNALVKLEEPSQPFRPNREEVAGELNKFLDGFVERYRELVGAVVRLSRDNSSNSTTSKGKGSSQQQQVMCCQYCSRGLYGAISKIVPESNDQILTKTLQNRLRQKLIVAFVCNDKDREVVRDILSEVAEGVWHIAVGTDDLADAEEKYNKEQQALQDNSTLITKHENDVDDENKNFGGKFSPAEKDDNNNNNNVKTSIGSSSPYVFVSPQEEKLYEIRFHSPKSLESMAKTLEHARNRVVWHSAAEMTRVTDAITEVAVSKRCPKALLTFNNTVVRQCAAAAQTHLVTQAQSLLTAKELARVAERLCDMGLAAGGPLATSISKNSAPVIEIQRTLDQMEALMNRFPKEAQEIPNPQFDLDSDDDDDLSAADGGKDGKRSTSADSGVWGPQESRNFAKQSDDISNVFAQMSKVIPMYRMKQSWDVYNQMVKNV